MEHRNIYHTCDRCGKRIGGNIRKLNFIRFFAKKPMDMCITSPNGYVIREFMDKFSNEINVEIQTCGKNENFQLCGECRRDFERFMKNE